MSYTDSQRIQHIKELQRYLYTISLFDSNIPRTAPDGVYDIETAEAVSAFQREYGLSPTGRTDSETWNKIVSVYRLYAEAKPLPCKLFPSADHIVKIGDTGALVYVIQEMLDRLGSKYDNLPNIRVSGEYNAETARAVMTFQRLVGLTPTGDVDCLTYNTIISSNK